MERSLKQADSFVLDITRSHSTINFKDLVNTFKYHFYEDQFFESEQALNLFEDMLSQSKVLHTNEEGEELVLNEQSEEVIKFRESDEYKNIREDRELFDYFFRETSSNKEGWILYYDEPDKKVQYKYEEGQAIVSC